MKKIFIIVIFLITVNGFFSEGFSKADVDIEITPNYRIVSCKDPIISKKCFEFMLKVVSGSIPKSTLNNPPYYQFMPYNTLYSPGIPKEKWKELYSFKKTWIRLNPVLPPGNHVIIITLKYKDKNKNNNKRTFRFKIPAPYYNLKINDIKPIYHGNFCKVAVYVRATKRDDMGTYAGNAFNTALNRAILNVKIISREKGTIFKEFRLKDAHDFVNFISRFNRDVKFEISNYSFNFGAGNKTDIVTVEAKLNIPRIKITTDGYIPPQNEIYFEEDKAGNYLKKSFSCKKYGYLPPPGKVKLPNNTKTPKLPENKNKPKIKPYTNKFLQKKPNINFNK